MDSIVIVGGGIVGTGLAHALREAPVDVTLVEKNTLGSGTTSKSIAMFSWLQHDPQDFHHELRERSWEVYEPLIDAGHISYETIGEIDAAESEPMLDELEEVCTQLQDFGIEVEMLEPAALDEFNINPKRLLGAMYTPLAGYLDPTEIIQYWSREAREAGVAIQTGVEVTDITTDAGTVTGIETTDSHIQADAVVNAAGPWSPEVAEMVGLNIPIRHTYGRILVLQVEEEISLPFIIFENGDYFREEGRNQVFAGQLEKSYAEAERFDPDAAHTIEDSFRQTIAENTSKSIPALEDAAVTNEWVGLRAITPDGDPLLGPTNVDGFHLATGMSGLGITLTPAVAEALADHLLTESNPIVERLSLDRFN